MTKTKLEYYVLSSDNIDTVSKTTKINHRQLKDELSNASQRDSKAVLAYHGDVWKIVFVNVRYDIGLAVRAIFKE